MYNEIDSNITFEDRDEYDRKGIAEKISILINSEIDVSPMLIDGKWGEGKTEFCHKLVNHLTNEGQKCVYVDAFKSDYIDDPLLILFAAISKAVDTSNEETLKKAAYPILSFALKTGGKAGLSWILRQDFDDLAKEAEGVIQDATNSVFEAVANKLIKGCQEQEKNIQALQTAIEAATGDNKLIVVIDELDRCRPSFSVELIEKIKHIFNTSSVDFILVANKDQLIASINHIYGANLIAGDYIEKFFTMTIKLTITSRGRRAKILNSIRHFQYELESLDNGKFENLKEGTALNKTICFFIEMLSLSLRQVEKLALNIKAYEKVYPGELEKYDNHLGAIFVSAMTINLFDTYLADKIIKEDFTGNEIYERLSLPHYNDATQTHSLRILSAMTFVMDKRGSQKDLEEHIRRLEESMFLWSARELSEGLRSLFVNFVNIIRFGTWES